MKSLFSLRLVVHGLAALWAATCLSAFAAEEAAEVDIAYYPLKPSFVSNLSGGPKYIRCDIQLMTEQAAQLPLIELHSAALRHRILMLLAGQDGKQLQTREGKETLRKAALGAVKEQLESFTGQPIVKDLYFTAYYVK
ncbi:MAG: flagellar basal body-associated FliL family protein [Sedimenticolaceae bacterium]